MVRPSAPVTDSDIQPLGQMPFGFRFNLQMRRGDPEALSNYLKAKGFTIGEMDPAGRLIIKDKYGNKYDANEALLGQDAITKGAPYVIQGIGSAAGAFMGHPTVGVAASSLASDAYSNLLDTAAGLPPKRGVKEMGTNAAIAGLLEKGIGAVGSAARVSSGLSGLKREGAAAATKAEQAIAKTRGEAEFGYKVTQAAEAAKQTEKALAEVKPDIFRTELANVLGVDEAAISRAVPAKTLDEMTARVEPLRNTVKLAVARNFEDLSKQFDEVLLPHAQTPITPTLITDSSAALQSNIIGEKTVAPALKKLFERVDDMAGGGVAIDPAVLRNIQRLRDAGDEQGAAALSKLVGGGGEGVNVKRALDLRADFQKLYRTSTSNLDRSASRQMIESIDETLAGVIPESEQPRLANLRANWGFASNLYDQTYRRGFRGAENPAEVARILYDSSTSGGKVATGKIGLVINDLQKNDPSSLPVVRQAFADNILSNDDPAKVLRSMNPEAFKIIFGMKETNKELADALESRIDVKSLAGNPQAAAAFQTYFDKGMSSLGAQKKSQALKAAESHLQNIPDPQALIDQTMATRMTPKVAGDIAVEGMEKPAEAYARASREGMKAPMFGHWNHYVQNRTTYQAALSLMAMGGGYASGYTATGILAGLTYIGGAKGSAWALSKPWVAEPYYKFLTSKTREQAAYYLGRMTAAELSQASRD